MAAGCLQLRQTKEPAACARVRPVTARPAGWEDAPRRALARSISRAFVFPFPPAAYPGDQGSLL